MKSWLGSMSLNMGVLILEMRTILNLQRRNLLALRRRAKKKRAKPQDQITPLLPLKGQRRDLDKPSKGSHSSSSSKSYEDCSGLSSSGEGQSIKVKDSVPKYRKPKVLCISVPNRHKSLIGRQMDRVQVSKELELSRYPCNLNELRRCRKVVNFCHYVAEQCSKYSDPFFPHRREARNFLNYVKELPIRKLLDLVEYKFECYSPNLPVWLFRRINKSLIIGNLFSSMNLKRPVSVVLR
jgi:hypothetical protein